MHKIWRKILGGALALALALPPVFSPAVSLASTPDAGSVATVTAASANRLGGIDRYETAAKIAQEGWSASEYAVLSAGMDPNLVDALTAAPLAQAKNAPILLTQGDALNEYAQAELTRLGVKTVYVTSGIGVITYNVLDKLAEMNITVVSLGGSNRFETAVNIAKQLGTPKRLVVTTAWNNADALSVAPIAAAKGMPILLTDLNELSGSVEAYINSIKSSLMESYVVGGTGVVSESVKNSLPSSKRAGGYDRYATNLEILQLFANDLKYSKTYLANGENSHLVDSLAGAPLAARSSSPILLTGNQLGTASRNYAKLNLSPEIVVLGGESVVPNQIVTGLTAAAEFTESGTVLGSDDPNAKKTFGESLTISGDNITLKHAIAEYGVYINGNNVTLNNVTVKGTVFVDPGQTGTATLDTVNAANVVVLSGAANSIHLKNVVADSLKVAGSNKVRVEASGSTNIAATVVNSAAIIDVVGGSVGQVQIGNAANQTVPEVELKGTFDKTVVVNGAAVVKAAGNANIARLEVAPENKEQKITLEGTFKSVQVNLEAKVELGKTAVVQELVSNAKAEINVNAGAKVDKFDNKGNTVDLTGGGASAVPASGAPSTMPASGSPSTMPASGGGGTVNNDANTSIDAFIIEPDEIWVTVENTDTSSLISGLVKADFTLFDGAGTEVDFNFETGAEYDPGNLPDHEYRLTPISGGFDGAYTVRFAKTGYDTANDTFSVTAVSSVTVSSAAQLQAAIQDNHIETIAVSGSFSGDVTATRSGSNNFVIDFADKIMTGNLSITANSAAGITFNGTASPSIAGNLTVAASSATVNNNMNVSGTIDIQAVSSHTWNQNGDAGKVDITANGGSFYRTGGTITEGVSIRPSASDNPIQLKGNMGGIPVVVEAPAKIEIAPDVDNPPIVTVAANAAGSQIENFKEVPLPITANGNVAVGGQVNVQAGSATVTRRQVRPTFNPVAGAVATGTELTINSAGATSIYYTTDGTEPAAAAGGSTLLYTPGAKPIINPGMTVKAIAVNDAVNIIDSNIGSAVYTAPVMGGTVAVTGDVKYGATLTAVISGVTCTPSDGGHNVLSYQWKRNGSAIGGAVNSTYTLVQEDIGAVITVTVTADGTNATGSVTGAATATVAKADGPSAPAAPTEASKTDTTVVLNIIAGAEYNVDGGAWQDSPEFTGLDADTTYEFRARIKETAAQLASGASTAAAITTDAPLKQFGGLYVEKNHRVNGLLGGTNAVIELSFPAPNTLGAAGYTLQYSGNAGGTWHNYQHEDSDLVTGTDTQDNFVLTNPGGNYQYRLFVNGGDKNGYVSNAVEADISSVDTWFQGWSLDESMTLSGVMAPFVGRGLEAAFTVQKLSDYSAVTGGLTYQWYRVNPENYDMTLIPGAASLSYTTTADDIGHYLMIRATGDGTTVGGYAQVLSQCVTVDSNIVSITNLSENGFTLNLEKPVANLSASELVLENSKGDNISIASVTQGATNQIYHITASLPIGADPFWLRNTSSTWRIVSLFEANHMMEGAAIKHAVHLVTYDGNGNTAGSVPADTNQYAENATVTVPGNTGSLVKTGYTFSGWNTQADGNGTDRAAASTFAMGTENVTLYAKWTAAEVAISAITSASMGIRQGSIVTGYTFSDASGVITYEQAISDAYALDLANSSVTLAQYNSAASSYTQVGNTVALSSLPLGNSDTQGESAKVTFADFGTLLAQFGIDFSNPANIPSHVKVIVNSKTSINGQPVANSWGPIDSGWTEIDSDLISPVNAEYSTAAISGDNKPAGFTFPVTISLKDGSNNPVPDGAYVVEVLSGSSLIGGGTVNFTGGSGSTTALIGEPNTYTLTIKVSGITIQTISNITVVSSPIFQSAAPTQDGSRILLTFDKAMADPAGKHGQFAILVNKNSSRTVTAAALKTDDNMTIELTLDSALNSGDTYEVAYTEGDVSSADGGRLRTFSWAPGEGSGSVGSTIYANSSLDQVLAENVSPQATVRVYNAESGGTLLNSGVNTDVNAAAPVFISILELAEGTTLYVSIQESGQAEGARNAVVAGPTLMRFAQAEWNGNNLQVTVVYDAGLSLANEGTVALAQFVLSNGSNTWTPQYLDILDQGGVSSDRLLLIFPADANPIPQGNPINLIYTQSSTDTERLKDVVENPVKTADSATFMVPVVQ